MKKNVTENQPKANRRNAKKGGVKTSQGKAVSKMNALKHGILSKEVVINKGDSKESLRELRKLKRMIHFLNS